MQVNPQRGASAPQPLKMPASDPRLHTRPQRPSVNTGQSSQISQTPTPGPTPVPASGLNPNLPHSATQPTVQSPASSVALLPRDVSSSEPGDFGSTLARFIESHTTLHVKRQEKENLEKQLASRRKFFSYLETKQGTTSTPAMLHMFQAYRNTDESEMRKLNKVLSMHAATSRQFTDALQKYQNPSSLGGDSIADLRAELKSEINSLKQSTHNSPMDPVAFEEKLAKINASVDNQSQMNRALQTDIGELAQWKLDLEEGNTKLPKSAIPADLDSIQSNLRSNLEQCQQGKTDIEKLRQDCSTSNANIESVKSELGGCDLKKNIDEMHASMSQVQITMDRVSSIENSASKLIENMETQLNAGAKHLEDRLEAAISAQNAELKKLEQQLNRLNIGPHVVAPVSPTGNVAVASNSTTTPRATDIPTDSSPVTDRLAVAVPTSSTSNISSSRLDSRIEQRLSGFEQVMINLQEKNKNLESTYKNLHIGISPIIQKGAEWVETVERCIQTTQILATGHRSLELRYNNINTEPMVRKMIHAIQEMYPSLSTLIEQIHALQEAENSRASEVATLKTRVDQLNGNASGPPLELLDKSVSGRIESLRYEMTGKYQHFHNSTLQQIGSLKGGIDRRWQELETRISAQLQSLPNSPTSSSHRQILDQINSLQEAQQAQTELFGQRLSAHIASLQGGHNGSSEEYVSNQIKSLREAQKSQRERFEEQILMKINTLQELQKAESATSAKNLEEINLLKGHFDLQQNAVKEMGEIGDKNGEDITAIYAQLEPLEALKSTVAGFGSQIQSQALRIDDLESPIRAIRTRVDELQAFGTASEIKACCDQLKNLKQEDIVSKVTKLNDLLSEKIMSYHAEAESHRESSPSNPETHPESSRSAATEAAATPKVRQSTQTRSESVRPQEAATQLTARGRSTSATKSQPPLCSPLGRPVHVSTDNATSSMPPRQTIVQTGAKRKRLSAVASENNRPGKKVSAPSQIGSSALPCTGQSSKKKRADVPMKERRRQGQVQQ